MSTQYEFRYDAPNYGPQAEPEDEARYSKQQEAVRVLMADGIARSVLEICKSLGLPPTTRVDSRLRDLRKKKHGGWVVKCQRFTDGVYRYILLIGASH